MEPAPELGQLMVRIVNALVVGDVTPAIDAMSHEDGTLVIGFDRREWWQGFDTIAALLRVQAQEWTDATGRPDLRFQRCEAWREGSVGWVAIEGDSLAGPETAARLTFVLHEEGAFWRVVQWHTSLSTSNEEALGRTITTSLDDLLISVQGDEAPASAMAGDGSVTIAFTDVEGSTALMESLGEERWLELLAWHDSVVRRQTAVFGGTVVKSQGDGYMLAFPAAGMAAACAVAIERATAAGWNGVPVPVRIGLHSGNATSDGGDFFGRTVVVAARVGAAATGGEVLVTEPVHQSLGESFAFDGVRSAELKGLAGSYPVFALAWR